MWTVIILKLKPEFSGLAPTTLQTGNKEEMDSTAQLYEGWNFNSGNHLFTTDTK